MAVRFARTAALHHHPPSLYHRMQRRQFRLRVLSRTPRVRVEQGFWRTCDTLCVLIRPTVPRDSAPPLLRRRRGRPPGGGLGEDELEVEVTAAALAAPCSSYCVVKLLWPDKDAPQVRVGAAAGERDRQVGRRCGQAEAEHSETAGGRQA